MRIGIIIMANFDIVLKFVLNNEGGYSNNEKDSGGATNFGISSKFLENNNLWRYDKNGNGVIDTEDMKILSEEDAGFIYKMLWDKYQYGLIESDDVAAHVFDMSVNAGQHQAILLLQRAYNMISHGEKLIEDGIVGNKTLTAINAVKATSLLMNAFIKQRLDFYHKIIAKHPEYKIFEKGWERRARA